MLASDTTDSTAPPSGPAAQGFWSSARGHFHAELPRHLERLTWSDDQLRPFQVQRLRRLLVHARDHSPFHARRLREIDPDTADLGSLQAIAPMAKRDLMSHFDEIVNDERACRAAAEAAVAATSTEAVPIADRWVVLASGGSTGERGLFVYDAAAFAEYGLSLGRPTMARLGAAGPPPGGMTIAMVAAASAIHATGSGPRVLDGGPVRFVPTPVTLGVEEIVARLNELSPAGLLGYPSMLTRLAREQQCGRLRIAPASVTASSETLRPDQRATIRAAFGVPIVNSYGASEGLAGASPPDDPVITFASDCCIVEPVDELDRPVGPGGTATSILVTNLFNLTQPLIRYRIEDRFVVHLPLAGIGHLRAEVDGRATDVLAYGGTAIHPLVISSPLEREPAIADHLIRQTPGGVDIDVVTTGPLDLPALAATLAAALRRAGLADPTVALHQVEDIPRDPQTGKRRQIVPLAPRAVAGVAGATS